MKHTPVQDARVEPKPAPSSGVPVADNPEREQTDESLRLEREKADDSVRDELTTVQDTADAVVTSARARADEVLAAARAKTDHPPAAAVPGPPSPMVRKKRAREDQILREERDHADAVLRDERAEHVALLSREREETDKDLSSERARADDALATRDEFLGIVSHDLRNMLNVVLGLATLIVDRLSTENPAEDVRMYAERIERSGARMDRLIGDLLDVASIRAGMLAVTKEVRDPAQVVAEAVELFQVQAAASGISLSSSIVPPALLASFDPARILQVLSNLLSNAMKFTPADGRVVVSLERFGDELRVAVSDTGVGIPSDKLEAIFVQFVQVTTNDRRGAGLGLYIAKCIVQGHEGRIWAESTINEGSTFYFTLPLHVAP